MYTFNRNNRECIHKMTPDAEFIDFTEHEEYYMVNDELNISHIKSGDMVKFILHSDETPDNKQQQKVYGLLMVIKNIQHTTFMVCKHFDELGNVFYLDYVYSSFLHAFIRLNRHGSFSDWNQLTHIKGAHAPKGFVDYWLNEHVMTEKVTECPENEYTTHQPNNETVHTSIKPGCPAPNKYLYEMINKKSYTEHDNNTVNDYIYWR